MVSDAPEDLDLHVTRLGESGPVLAFCHGLFGQGKNWTTIARAFAADHRVLLVDMPNHGRSAWTERFDYLELADMVAGLFDGDGPVRLVGHSMGGKIAMALALRHPDLVERLAVVDVAPVPYDNGREFAGYLAAMKAIDLTTLGQRSEADEALREAVPHPTVRSFLLQNLRRVDHGWEWQANLDLLSQELVALSGWPGDELEGTAAFDKPVLWMGGARSAYVSDEHAEVMDRWFPHNRRVTIKDAGHWVHSEQPEVFVEVLRRFLG